MPDKYRSGDKFRDISATDARLAELEQEKQKLIALREELQKYESTSSVSDSFSPEQKIAIFRNLFRGRTDIFTNRWQNQRGRSGNSVACDNEWVQGICNKPRIKCQDCNHRQFSELDDQVTYRHLAGQQVVGLYPLLQDGYRFGHSRTNLSERISSAKVYSRLLPRTPCLINFNAKIRHLCQRSMNPCHLGD